MINNEINIMKGRFKFPEPQMIKNKNKRDMRKKIVKSDFPTYTNNKIRKGEEGMAIKPVIYSPQQYNMNSISKSNISKVFDNYTDPSDFKEGDLESILSSMIPESQDTSINDDDFQLSELDETPIIKNYVPKNNKEYVEKMSNAISTALENNGIDPTIWTRYLVAQTCIESGWGRSSISTNGNNYGGIKGGNAKPITTREYDPSKGYYTVKSSFKRFNSVQDFADYFVKKLKNKFGAFNGTPQEYLKNIKNHGYFTEDLSKYTSSFNGVLKTISNMA